MPVLGVAAGPAKSSVPLLTVVPPVYVFVPVRTSIPGPVIVMLPLPLIAPANVWLLGLANVSRALSVMPPATEPFLLAPSPSCSVPSVIVVPPM